MIDNNFKMQQILLQSFGKNINTNPILQGNQYQLPPFFTYIDVFDESPRKRKRVTFDSDCK